MRERPDLSHALDCEHRVNPGNCTCGKDSMKTYRVTVPAWLSFTVEAASEEEALTLAVETSEDLEIAEPFPAILEDSYINVPKSVETECQALEPHHVSKAMMIS